MGGWQVGACSERRLMSQWAAEPGRESLEGGGQAANTEQKRASSRRGWGVLVRGGRCPNLTLPTLGPTETKTFSRFLPVR